ncbi:hypothetical protein [Rhodovulum strictum]|uniref:Uncharacterized protein n=1 Tax=Rhodovulum strictum TaxID=58314 RepID=A0A844BNY2_9RHOB|nr:hypothetical protein [Rhodovulum strictum]MRH22643.1 hypothetical protein [Rhodovulum strictum]
MTHLTTASPKPCNYVMAFEATYETIHHLKALAITLHDQTIESAAIDFSHRDAATLMPIIDIINEKIQLLEARHDAEHDAWSRERQEAKSA